MRNRSLEHSNTYIVSYTWHFTLTSTFMFYNVFVRLRSPLCCKIYYAPIHRSIVASDWFLFFCRVILHVVVFVIQNPFEFLWCRWIGGWGINTIYQNYSVSCIQKKHKNKLFTTLNEMKTNTSDKKFVEYCLILFSLWFVVVNLKSIFIFKGCTTPHAV